MSEKKLPKTPAGNIAAGIALVTSVAPLVKPAIDAVRTYADKVIDDRKSLVSVPELYSKEYPLTVEQAVELLENCGLKATLVKMAITDAAAQYSGCFPSQVIKTRPRSKQKVERGSSVLVKYITQEVIDESKRMHEISEKHKIELVYAQNIHRIEKKEKTKRAVIGTLNAAKQGLNKIPKAFRKQENSDE